MNARHQTIAVFIALAAAFALPAAAAAQTIGLSLPMSGQYDVLARQFLAGARLALEDHNGQAASKAELAIVDDGCDRDIAKLAAEELLEAAPAIVTGMLCNDAAYEIATRLRESGIPILVAGARSVRLISDREREEWHLWRLSPGDDEASIFMAEKLSRDWAGKAYAIVDDGTAVGRTQADGFRAGMEAAGLPPQFQDTFRPTQSTQARLVRRLASAGVTHAFIAASAEDIAMIARNSAEIGTNLTIAGTEMLDILPLLAEDERPPAGIVAGLLARAESRPEAMKVLERIALRGGQPEPVAIQGYQAMQVALQATGASNAETAASLSSRTFATILGEVAFSTDGSRSGTAYELYLWDGEDFTSHNQF